MKNYLSTKKVLASLISAVFGEEYKIKNRNDYDQMAQSIRHKYTVRESNIKKPNTYYLSFLFMWIKMGVLK